MSKTNSITADRLRELTDYDPETGIFTWKVKVSRKFQIGDPAGHVNSRGYVQICIEFVNHRAHRLAWMYVTGKFPSGQIDHIDGNRSNNAFRNLRDVTQFLNMRNQKLSKRNTSGVSGVYYVIGQGKWNAQINTNQGRVCLGYFQNKEDAIKVRKAAEIKHGYHVNHGRDQTTRKKVRCEMTNNEPTENEMEKFIAELKAARGKKLEDMQADAKRYRFIRDCMTRCSPMMSNENYFFFSHPKSTGSYLTEAIDKEMKRMGYE